MSKCKMSRMNGGHCHICVYEQKACCLCGMEFPYEDKDQIDDLEDLDDGSEENMDTSA